MEASPVRLTVPWLAAIALAAVLTLTGCGDDAERTGETVAPADETPEKTEALDTQVPDLCSLFTAKDFQAVTGETAGEPVADEATGAIRGTCTINAEAGFPLVVLAAYNESDRETTLSMVEAEPVDDLGTEAYWDDAIGLVIPLEGKDWYLQVMATDGGADLATSAQVAEIALDRLGG
jgi:hypothetical protein